MYLIVYPLCTMHLKFNKQLGDVATLPRRCDKAPPPLRPERGRGSARFQSQTCQSGVTKKNVELQGIMKLQLL